MMHLSMGQIEHQEEYHQHNTNENDNLKNQVENLTKTFYGMEDLDKPDVRTSCSSKGRQA